MSAGNFDLRADLTQSASAHGSAGIDPRLSQLEALLSAALSRLICADADTAERLARLDGFVIEFSLRDHARSVYAMPSQHGVDLRRQHQGPVAVRVSGRIADFIAYARARRRGDSLGAGRIEISGDLAVAQDVQALLTELNFDWEELLSRAIGDVPAHQFGRFARAAATWGMAALRKFERDTTDYLLHEARLVAARREIEQLGRDIFRTSDDVERLAARLERYRERGA